MSGIGKILKKQRVWREGEVENEASEKLWDDSREELLLHHVPVTYKV